MSSPTTARRSLWRDRDFQILWGVETVSQAGAQVSVLALPLTAVFVLQADPAEVGILTALQFAPVVLITLFAGVWLDRHRRRPALVVSNLGRFLLLALIPILYVTGDLTLGALFAVTFAAGFLTAIADVAYLVYLPSLVRSDQLLDANAKLEATYSVAQVGGPGLGGLLVQAIGAPLAVIADAATYLLASVGLLAIRAEEPRPRPEGAGASLRAEIATGLALVVRHPVLRALMISGSVFNLFEQAVLTLYVLFAVQDLGLSPGVLGAVLAVGSVGGLGGSIIAERTARRLRAGRATLTMGLVGAIGLGIVPFAGGGAVLATVVLMVGFVVYGIGLGAFNVVSLSLRAALVPPGQLGRLTASFRLLVYGTIPLGALLGGGLGQVLGVRPAIALAAGGLIVSALLLWSARTLRYADMPQAAAVDADDTVDADSTDETRDAGHGAGSATPTSTEENKA